MNSYETILNKEYLDLTIKFIAIYKGSDMMTKNCIDYLIAKYREKRNKIISISVKDYMVSNNLTSLDESYNHIMNGFKNVYKISVRHDTSKDRDCKFNSITSRLVTGINANEETVNIYINKPLFNAILAIKEK